MSNPYSNAFRQFPRRKHCENCGTKKSKRLYLHHKDENKRNDRPGNLETLCGSCHQKVHGRGTYGEIKCVECGSVQNRYTALGLCYKCYGKQYRETEKQECKKFRDNYCQTLSLTNQD